MRRINLNPLSLSARVAAIPKYPRPPLRAAISKRCYLMPRLFTRPPLALQKWPILLIATDWEFGAEELRSPLSLHSWRKLRAEGLPQWNLLRVT